MSAGHRLLHRACLALYFDRCSLRNPSNLPRGGPALYLGLHRNGALDGLAYRRFLPRATFMISRQLVRSPLSRLLFDGIAVARNDAEGDRAGNRDAMRECRKLLDAGGELFIFPEGTSTLGPHHLPFRPGAAAILADWLLDGGDRALPVVPLAICYDDPTRFRSRVEVIAGPPVALPDPSGATREDLVARIAADISRALESVGANFPDERAQDVSRALAAIRCADGRHSFHAALKALEKGVSPDILSSLERLEGALPQPAAATPAVAACLLLAPVVLLAAWANLPPLLAGHAAGRRFPDGPNVVSLWRVLVGIPAFGFWAAAVAAAAAIAGHPLLVGAWAALTAAGLAAYRPWRTASAGLANLARHPDSRAGLLRLRALLAEVLP
jgi:1-acyl-sn-glycerol-3-phosphate acyltransferase